MSSDRAGAVVVIRSPWPSLAPYPRRPLWGLLASTARRLPDKPGLIEADGAVSTYHRLWRASWRAAGFLQRRANVARGETVAITTEGSLEFVAAMYGSLMAGARVTPLHPSLLEGDLARHVMDAEATVAVVSAQQRARIEGLCAAGALPRLRRVYPLEGLVSMAEVEGTGPDPVPIEGERDLAFLAYTSGTGGLPKGAMLTHANLVASALQQSATSPAAEASVVLSLLPFWFAIRWTLASGATCVQPALGDPERTLWLVRRYRVSHVLGRPYSLQALLRQHGGSDRGFESLRLLEVSGAPLPAPIAREAERRFRCPVIQSYRLTEAAGSANRGLLQDVRPGAVGPPVPDTEERIVTPDSGEDVPPGEGGELLIRGPQVAQGYWRHPEATAETFLPGGWMRTGDIARQDADGHVSIVDRAKELLKVRGISVAPAEIEAVLLEHPAVRDAAVIPVPSASAGELPKAFVVVEQGHRVTAATLIALVARRLTPDKLIHEVEFVPALPRNAAGKTLRRALVERERSRRAAP